MEASGPVEAPPLGWEPRHFLVADLYRAAVDSAQAVYFEPSDWATLRLILFQADAYLAGLEAGGRLSSTMLETITRALGSLLFTESDRRRVRVEVARTGAGASEDASVTALAGYRKALGLEPPTRRGEHSESGE
uniref:phage terminase small subunit n=1 Tax=Kineococcus sp. SYSU DK007 TaxID=3383128 RepID=UPI003D7E2E18